MKIIWSKTAVKHFLQAVSYIALDNKLEAEKFYLFILDKVEHIINFPNLGRLSNHIYGERELILHKNYLITYKIENEELKIISFWHNKRNRD